MDVAFKVHTFRIYGETVKIKGVWLNQGFNRTFVIDYNPQTLSFKKEKLGEWLILHHEDQNLECVRNARWVKVLNA
jgi:hypothetical protein